MMELGREWKGTSRRRGMDDSTAITNVRLGTDGRQVVGLARGRD